MSCEEPVADQYQPHQKPDQQSPGQGDHDQLSCAKSNIVVVLISCIKIIFFFFYEISNRERKYSNSGDL